MLTGIEVSAESDMVRKSSESVQYILVFIICWENPQLVRIFMNKHLFDYPLSTWIISFKMKALSSSLHDIS